jgi:hypothetical protein
MKWLLGKDPALLLLAGSVFAFVFKYWFDTINEGIKRRVEIYERLRKGFDEEPAFYPVFGALDARDSATTQADIVKADAALANLDSKLKVRFAAFIEDVGLYTKSGVLGYRLANYEFGDYTRMCYQYDAFWSNICSPGKDQKTEPLWAMFRQFHRAIEPFNAKLEANPDKEVERIEIGVDWWRFWKAFGPRP